VLAFLGIIDFGAKPQETRFEEKVAEG